MTIIDLTEEQSQEVKKKKIELVSCLQHGFNDNDEYYFYKGTQYDVSLKNATKIRRLAKDAVGCFGLDLIQVDKIVFLGYWNDGVI